MTTAKCIRTLADLISLSPLKESVRRERLERALDRAVNYFEDAIQQDNAQASSYFELGELWYSSAHDYGIDKYHNLQKALDYYEIASKRYTATEVSKGWRADSFRRIGEIKTELALEGGSPADTAALKQEAEVYIRRARDEYESANTGAVKRVQDNLAQLTDYSKRLQSVKGRAEGVTVPNR